MKLASMIKKHQKTLMIGGGIAAALYFMSKKSSTSASVMPIGPTVQELKAISGPLGSLE